MSVGSAAARVVVLALWIAAARAGAEPLDPFDATARQILVELENSATLAVVGQSYAAPVPASYSVSGGVGTVVIPVASHEQMRGTGLEPVPGTFTPIVIEIDLADLEATSQSASGVLESGGQVMVFTQHVLGSETVGGHFSSAGAPLFCTSQQDVDDACQVTPALCGLTCVIVPGAAYDAVTGKMNLVGAETVQGCDGSFCIGPFDFFSQRGDLRLTEAPVVPALGAPAAAVLAACLLLAGRAAARHRRVSALLGVLVLFASARAGAEPLDPFDATLRSIEVELENSSSPGAVGQSYAAPVPATYSASGGTGTVTIPVASHEQMRAGGLTPIPGTFTQVVIEIDLGDLGATSQTASGAMQSGPLLAGFTQNPLGTDSVAGYVVVEGVASYCASQQQVDDACLVNPLYCGLTCVIVPGAAYDPLTGKVNLVGSETQQGCDGALCFGPFVYFSKHGDLRLSEGSGPLPPVVPALGAPGQALLAACLLLAGWAAFALRRRTAGS